MYICAEAFLKRGLLGGLVFDLWEPKALVVCRARFLFHIWIHFGYSYHTQPRHTNVQINQKRLSFLVENILLFFPKIFLFLNQYRFEIQSLLNLWYKKKQRIDFVILNERSLWFWYFVVLLYIYV